jgi:hypothetical protein
MSLLTKEGKLLQITTQKSGVTPKPLPIRVDIVVMLTSVFRPQELPRPDIQLAAYSRKWVSRF